ncbi:hypothetical protein MMMB2_3923 [Mycobacterium marinum MB2]|nr:hypothetical protein MMMB2_3923 [Mycobacterium marinum MB2]
MLWCIDNYEIVGDFDLGEAVERLAATVVRVASASDQENLPKWHVVINGFVWPFAINVLAAIPSAGLTQLALPQ